MSSRQPEKEGIPKKKKNMRKRMSMVYHYSVLSWGLVFFVQFCDCIFSEDMHICSVGYIQNHMY